MTWRRFWWAVRIAIATTFAAVGVKLCVVALHIPIEAGGMIFSPLLLGGALFFFWLAVGTLFPTALRGGLAFWSGLVNFF